MENKEHYKLTICLVINNMILTLTRLQEVQGGRFDKSCMRSRNKALKIFCSQPLAHGHESSICVKGFNGVVLESTYSEEKTADFLDSLKTKAIEREHYRAYLEGKTK